MDFEEIIGICNTASSWLESLDVNSKSSVRIVHEGLSYIFFGPPKWTGHYFCRYENLCFSLYLIKCVHYDRVSCQVVSSSNESSAAVEISIELGPVSVANSIIV